MSRLELLAHLAIALLVTFPARAQEAATFHCTFKAVYETAESDNPTKSNFEKQFVGHRLDVLITDKPTAKVVGDVFTITKQAAEYVVSQRGSMRNDWVLLRTDRASASGTITETITVIHIRTWNEPVRFTFARFDPRGRHLRTGEVDRFDDAYARASAVHPSCGRPIRHLNNQRSIAAHQ